MGTLRLLFLNVNELALNEHCRSTKKNVDDYICQKSSITKCIQIKLNIVITLRKENRGKRVSSIVF